MRAGPVQLAWSRQTFDMLKPFESTPVRFLSYFSTPCGKMLAPLA